MNKIRLFVLKTYLMCIILLPNVLYALHKATFIEQQQKNTIDLIPTLSITTMLSLDAYIFFNM